jgi:hypothetical protein
LCLIADLGTSSGSVSFKACVRLAITANTALIGVAIATLVATTACRPIRRIPLTGRVESLRGSTETPAGGPPASEALGLAPDPAEASRRQTLAQTTGPGSLPALTLFGLARSRLERLYFFGHAPPRPHFRARRDARETRTASPTPRRLPRLAMITLSTPA